MANMLVLLFIPLITFGTDALKMSVSELRNIDTPESCLEDLISLPPGLGKAVLYLSRALRRVISCTAVDFSNTSFGNKVNFATSDGKIMMASEDDKNGNRFKVYTFLVRV
ncbi:unnamed protein product [Leptosia nina]|uniref:Uncharacterized protein n=1 Tax=Leptosia nina TaxID=320188 RepID=A0AAV1JMI8_9NEOP